MKAFVGGEFQHITPDYLLALIEATPPSPEAHWHFRVRSIAEYHKLALTISDGRIDVITSPRITVWCSPATAKKVRKRIAAIRAEEALVAALEGINAS